MNTPEPTLPPIPPDLPTIGQASDSYLTMLAAGKRREEELERVRAEVLNLHQRHAAALMEMQTILRRANATAEGAASAAVAAQGQAAILARSLRKMIGHLEDTAHSAGWAGLPEDVERDRAEASAALVKWSTVED